MSASASPLPAVDGRLIDEYVAGLSARLRGPGRMKADLLAEARDGLVDAAEAYAAAGYPPAEAATRALADFGSHRAVIASYQAELAAAQGRRTGLLVAVAMPAMLVGARLLGADAAVSGVGIGRPLVSYAVDVFQVTAAIMAGLTLLGYGWGSRFLPAARVPAAVVLTRLMGVGVLAFIVATGLTGTLGYAWGPHHWPPPAGSVPLLAGAAGRPLVLLLVAGSAIRCLRASAPAVAPGTPRSST